MPTSISWINDCINWSDASSVVVVVVVVTGRSHRRRPDPMIGIGSLQAGRLCIDLDRSHFSRLPCLARPDPCTCSCSGPPAAAGEADRSMLGRRVQLDRSTSLLLLLLLVAVAVIASLQPLLVAGRPARRRTYGHTVQGPARAANKPQQLTAIHSMEPFGQNIYCASIKSSLICHLPSCSQYERARRHNSNPSPKRSLASKLARG